MLAGLSRWDSFRMPPAFCASAGPPAAITASNALVKVITKSFNGLVPFALFVEPDVFSAIAVENAIDHQRQPLDVRLPAGCAAGIEDDRTAPPSRTQGPRSSILRGSTCSPDCPKQAIAECPRCLREGRPADGTAATNPIASLSAPRFAFIRLHPAHGSRRLSAASSSVCKGYLSSQTSSMR